MDSSAPGVISIGVDAAEGRKATDVVALDLRGISSITDYFVICSGSSDTNVRAIADAVEEKLAAEGIKPFGVEGRSEGTWILLDYVDFVFHIFHHEKRAAFSLEELWSDAGRLEQETTAPPGQESP